MADDILDVDLLDFEKGDRGERQAVVDGVRRSLQTGFVYTSHDLPEDLLDQAYDMLADFFSEPTEVKARFVAPGSHGQTGYTGLLVETAASSDVPDWKEMLNWGREAPLGHPLRAGYPHRYGDQVLPEAAVPGITAVLNRFHDTIADLQRRFLHIIALAVGCHEDFFERMLRHGPHLTRAIHYPAMDLAPGQGHVWAGEHGDINLITALPRASAPGLQVKTDSGWVDAVAPEGHVIINTGMMLEQLTNGVIPTGIHRVVSAPGHVGERYSVVQFCHPTPWTILSPVPSCVSPEQPLRYGAIAAGDRLDEVLWEINLVEDGRRVS
ncbi:MAG TPA: 2-oxoglutarate and iron-dependent oxygenase domain-containing protein [Acidimicrobiales bacterium]|nr:2-oxoglutarate and iron-dependent oxygenase domain-containing protein [Acidimicrobiales bacterium]